MYALSFVQERSCPLNSHCRARRFLSDSLFAASIARLIH